MVETPAVGTAPSGSTRWGRFRRFMRELGWRYLIAALALFFALFPVAWVVTSAINPIDTLTTVSFLPDSVTFDNFTALFEGCNWSLGVPPFECPETTTPFPLWLWNTIKIALLATIFQLIFSALAAYSFSRLRWRGRRLGLITILLVQMFPSFLAFVALFLLLDTLEETFGEAIQTELWVIAILLALVAAFVVWTLNRASSEATSTARRYGWVLAGFALLVVVWAIINPGYGVTVFPKIGLGTHTGLILVYLAGSIGVNTWLIKGFMDSIPTSLDEAAKVDGATEWDVFAKIILPLSQPILIVIFILTFVNLYNEFILAAILIQDVEQFTYATGLALFVDSDYAAKWGQLSAAAVIGTTPILILYWSLQDRIVSALQGAVKG
jgi:ABC-type maltose transport system permease subunit